MGARAGQEIVEHEIIELRREVERQRDELTELRARIDARPVEGPEGSADADRPMSRRRLLGMAGAATAGAVGATMLAATPAGATAVTLGAADGDAVQIGGANTGTGKTGLSSPVAGSLATFDVTNTLGGVGAHVGIEGSAFGTGGVGVHATTDTGIAISAEVSGSGVGVSAMSSSGDAFLAVPLTGQSGAPLRLAPHASVAGPPTSTAHTLGQLWMDNAGVLWQCTVAGSPGTWGRVALLGVEAQNAGSGATSVTSTASGAATFRAVNTGTNNGLEGSASAATGVVGTTSSSSNAGVLGAATGSGSGVVGSSASGAALRAGISTTSSAGAHLDLIPHGTVTGPPSGSHNVGQFWMDATGVLFQCVVTGNPGTWVRQAPLVTLASPVRVYDSRAGKPNQAPNVQGVLSFTASPPSANNRVIRCSKDASTGATVIPVGARTLLLNVTAVAVSGVGALSVYGDGAAQPLTSNLNWTGAGQVVANAVTSACDTSQDIRVAVPASVGASANFIVDVFGYYL